MNNIGKTPTNCICWDGNIIPATLFRRHLKKPISPFKTFCKHFLWIAAVSLSIGCLFFRPHDA